MSGITQTAMVFTPQKPTQRDRKGEIPEGLPGSTVERGMRGKKRQDRGRPSRLLPRREEARKASQGIRIWSHGRGNPGTDGGRRLSEAEDESDRAQPGGPPEQNEGRPRV